MRVVEPHEFKGVKHPGHKKKRRPVMWLVALLVVIAAVAFVAKPSITDHFAVKNPQTTSQQPTQTSPSGQTASSQPLPTPVKSYTYCAKLRGVGEEELSAFTERIDFALNSNRGWSLGNKIAFKKVDTGCDFTIWLSSPEYMTSFGGNCDSEWSCRAGDAVVANYDKWKHASPAWRDDGGSLDFYRVMVVNHEVGHWFGFEHKQCGGTGQLAPVMQQQSVDLEGCRFNPWPTNAEKAELQKQLGL